MIRFNVLFDLRRKLSETAAGAAERNLHTHEAAAGAAGRAPERGRNDIERAKRRPVAAVAALSLHVAVRSTAALVRLARASAPDASAGEAAARRLPTAFDALDGISAR